ncbi:hypothetical protein EJ08DRAFT_698705 [Tothia fuscella]|uniref:DUF7909 domain-containing protein n=1 Tax=Tothia fuscella TaxID=1048955 RepID=A0A9P4TXS0_9PEZI|nr:hypothetical protein EJ08DRAFT_698705 [Tothia fuscella]
MYTLIIPTFALAIVACTIPTTKLSNNIAEPFSVLLQNASYPAIHNHYMNIWDWGGSEPHDQHLFVSPAGNSTSELTLIDGVISLMWNPIRRAVINLEYNEKDNTTKMFMTDRNDNFGIFDVVYGCNPDTDELQRELHVKSRGTVELGGEMGVKPFAEYHDFRWRAPGTTIVSLDPQEIWTKVTMVVVPAGKLV